ncbi:MAG: Uncharacterized MFS-type transporter, partial [uncultured Solirubrobacteraceae bacterium]
ERHGDPVGGRSRRHRRPGTRSQPMVGAGGGLLRAVHGDPRRDDRQRRAADHPERSADLRQRPAMGGELLHAGLRRTAAARRPRVRSARTASHLRGRHTGVLARLAGQRPGVEPGVPHPLPGAAGHRRGAHLARRPQRDHDDVRRGRRAVEGAGRMERDRGRRRRRRPAAGRRDHRVALVGVDLLHQRADRPGGHRGGVSLGARIARRSRPSPFRLRGRRERHRRSDAARVHDRRDARPRIHERPHAASLRGLRAAAGRLRGDREPDARPARPSRPAQGPLTGRRQRRDARRLVGDVRLLLLRHALPAAGAGLRPDRGGPRVPSLRALDRRRRRHRPGRREEARRAVVGDDRPDRRRDRPAHHGRHARHRRLLLVAARRHGAHGHRPRLDLRAVHADRDDQRRRRGGRPGVGHLQHQPADRRSPGPGDPLDARQRHAGGPPAGARPPAGPARLPRRCRRGLPDRFLRRRRPAPARHARPHLPVAPPRRGHHRHERGATAHRL